MKLLSIVIANYNYGRFIEEAIQSVVLQHGFEECELIICDAASTDNSIEIIRKHADKLAWWCSEKDGGQSEAFNKGFSHATGKYLTWLNADDILVPGCLRKILSEMKKHPDCEWFTGNFFRFIETTGKVCEIAYGPHWYPNVLQRKNSPYVTFGPSSFFSRKIYEQVGKIDERFHYIMDSELWISFIMRGIKKRRIPCLCWAFRLHEESKTSQFGDHGLSEKAKTQGKIEERLLEEKHHYRMSRLIWCLICAVRLIDGSFLRRWWLRRKYMGADRKTVKV